MGTDHIRLNISSPEMQPYSLETDCVTLPGENGRFTVLPGHAPLISTLTEGDILYTAAGKESALHIKSGFAEVGGNMVCVSAEL